MLLELTGLSMSYRTRGELLDVLDDVSLDVDAGELVGLIGVSGSGKSTIARIAVGLEASDSGTIAFDGVSCDAHVPPHRRPREFKRALLGMQMVFQHPASTFPRNMTMGRAVAEGIAYRDVPRGEYDRRVREALAQVGLPESYLDKRAWELSGGECQRAAIARAIISGPKLLVCDEPTSSLDVTIQAQIVRLIRDLCVDLGMACLFISHDLALVRGLCSRAYVLDAGHIVEEGPCAQLFDAPQAEVTKRLLAAL